MTDQEPLALFPDASPLIWWRERSSRLVSYRCGRGRRCRRLLAEVFDTPGGAVVRWHIHAPDRLVAMPREIVEQRDGLRQTSEAGSIKKYESGGALLRGDTAHPGWVVALESDPWWSNVVTPSCGRHGAFPQLLRSVLMDSTRRARSRGVEELLTLS